MAGSTYDALQTKKNQLIRKFRNGSVFGALHSADPITTLTDPTDGGLVALPTGYKDWGWFTDDGLQYSRDIETSDTTSAGSNEPTRTDIDSDTTSLQVVFQETRLETVGLYLGMDLSDVTAATGAGAELKIDKPETPPELYYRVLGLSVDFYEGGEIYIGRYLPRAKVTDFGDQQHTRGDDAIGYDVTFQGFVDSTEGTSERWFFAGPGWKALLADMDITQAT